MADKSNHPRVEVSVTGGAVEGGGLDGVQGLLALLPALSLVLQQPVSLVLTSPHPFSNSTPPCTAVVCYLLPGAWVNVCKFKIALADILEMQCRAACVTVSCCQLPIQHIFWDAVIAHAIHVAKPAQPVLTEEDVYAVRASTPQHSSIGDLSCQVMPRMRRRQRR